MPTTKVSIPGIHCEGCVKLIKDVTNDFPLVTNADVDLNAKTVTLDHEPDFDMAKWSEEIESLDEKYKVHPLP
jgi:copper chaperone